MNVASVIIFSGLEGPDYARKPVLGVSEVCCLKIPDLAIGS